MTYVANNDIILAAAIAGIYAQALVTIGQQPSS